MDSPPPPLDIDLTIDANHGGTNILDAACIPKTQSIQKKGKTERVSILEFHDSSDKQCLLPGICSIIGTINLLECFSSSNIYQPGAASTQGVKSFRE
jgi:hypothetical protein